MIKARHIPHYIIKSRNLFNSKLTETMSTEIVDVLSKFDMTRVFRLDTFKCVFEVTHYNNLLLKHETIKSTIMACLNAYMDTLSSYIGSSTVWNLYIPHNATNSLLKYKNILQNLKKVKGVSIQLVLFYLLKLQRQFVYQYLKV